MKSQMQRLSTALAGIGLVATLFFAGAATAAPAGGGGRGHGGHHEQRLEKMQTELGLSADQVSRIKAIMESNKSEYKAIKERMKSTFTPEQQAQMKSWRENREKGQRPSKEDMKAKWASLGLSDTQQAQLKGYREEMKTKHESVRSQINAVLTPEQQAKAEQMKQEYRGKRGDRGRGNKSSNG